jgi:hypothetical protein
VYQYARCKCLECGHDQTTKAEEIESKNYMPLLTIEVSDLHSVPVVKYKGELISGTVKVAYEYLTRGNEDEHGSTRGKQGFALEYCESDENGKPTIKEIKQKKF